MRSAKPRRVRGLFAYGTRMRVPYANRPYRKARFSMTDASALISTSYSRYLARAVAARPALTAHVAAWAA
ncbi:hypothetical protein G3N57_36820, partial [Paraburkholderia sp. Se-20369]|nr:hypothetical protein [Paraburkholderia sp. Se-20369]